MEVAHVGGQFVHFFNLVNLVQFGEIEHIEQQVTIAYAQSLPEYLRVSNLQGHNANQWQLG